MERLTKTFGLTIACMCGVALSHMMQTSVSDWLHLDF